MQWTEPFLTGHFPTTLQNLCFNLSANFDFTLLLILKIQQNAKKIEEEKKSWFGWAFRIGSWNIKNHMKKWLKKCCVKNVQLNNKISPEKYQFCEWRDIPCHSLTLYSKTSKVRFGERNLCKMVCTVWFSDASWRWSGKFWISTKGQGPLFVFLVFSNRISVFLISEMSWSKSCFIWW